MELENSPLVRQKGKGIIVKFRIVQNGKEIEPWLGKSAEIMEWMRNSSALLGQLREEIATFWKVQKDDMVYFEDSLQADKKMEMAYFTSEKDGQEYNVAKRLLNKDIKIGDRVRLEILGCCSIIDVEKVKEEEEEE
jgi:hypothetical protein